MIARFCFGIPWIVVWTSCRSLQGWNCDTTLFNEFLITYSVYLSDHIKNKSDQVK